jgi:excisionase family DNA binding protein
MPASLLTTGQAARLCSVKPDTVLKWIKRGRIPATRTAGGHFRVEQRDVLGLLSQNSYGNGTCEEEPAALCSRPRHCWEYMGHGPGTECQECTVYRVRALWCFRLVNLLQGAGHGKRFCGVACQECPYYRRVHGLPTNVLVITRDEALIHELAKREGECLSFRFARRGYDASAIINVFRPAFVIIDQATIESLGVALLEALTSDQRTAGAKIVVAIRKGAMGFRIENSAVFATVEEPFSADEIAAMINRIPVERVQEEANTRA